MGGESLIRLPFVLLASRYCFDVGSACTRPAATVSLRLMTDLSQALEVAVAAAREAGALLSSHFGKPPEVNELQAHDIKLALDVETQELITERLLNAFPD